MEVEHQMRIQEKYSGILKERELKLKQMHEEINVI
jgi:hypothetical protein